MKLVVNNSDAYWPEVGKLFREIADRYTGRKDTALDKDDYRGWLRACRAALQRVEKTDDITTKDVAQAIGIWIDIGVPHKNTPPIPVAMDQSLRTREMIQDARRDLIQLSLSLVDGELSELWGPR